MTDMQLSAWMRQRQAEAESALDRILPDAAIAPQRLHEAMRYATLGGGKRVRPLLVFAAGELANASQHALEQAACAVELIHAYSLVHDDMPCMDDDVLRRGKPTVHVQYDDATALLVGDALQTLAFQSLSETALFDDAVRQVDALRLLALASGSRGMAGGQAIDLESVGQAISREALEVMHLHKTGALIRASVQLGALCGNADPASLAALDRFGKAIGLLFQVVDDLLDAAADTATLGKTAGKDAANNKPTYVTLLGATEAKRLAEDLRRDAHDSLAAFGDRARRLAQLTDYIVDRSF
ncbi:polyprenyl synthetase family protein [Niveibacterium sp. 24ML]|uniref:polyprenyl synthetase family protein n=1 Tax=Niveibacterium sp. 24ML TaxID=2985512 RepID=UPI00226EA4B2|nr:farnesyl diphosphate synthase [Niveibacterium sp. 24ML]MCX9156760.1 polyprenyl synthetase family protein [Niveibacterium sp. 24ML]